MRRVQRSFRSPIRSEQAGHHRAAVCTAFRRMMLLSALALVPCVASAIGPHAAPSARAAAGAIPRIELPARPLALVENRPGAGLEQLEASTGSAWRIGWHPWIDVARQGWGGRPRSAQRLREDDIRSAADAFRLEHARILGAEGLTLRETRRLRSRRSWHATWQQWHEGRRVLGSWLDLTLLKDGTVVAFRSTLAPQLRVRAGAPDLVTAERRCEELIGADVEVVTSEPVLVVEANATSFVAVEAVELLLTVSTGARWRAVVATSASRVMQLESRVRTSELTGTASGRVKPYYSRDPYVDVPLSWLGVQLGFAGTDPHTFADDSGSFQFAYREGQVTLRSALTGRFVSVDNETNDPSPSFEAEVTVPGDVEVRFGAVESRADERTIYYHVNTVHDFMAERFGFALLDFPVPAIASARDPWSGDPNYPNAHWDGESLGFGNGGRTFWNMGMHGDVVYHEYTHAVTDFMYRPTGDLEGAIGGAIHEALADYFPATMTNDPRLGENLLRATPAPLRNLDNSLYWPDDRDDEDEVHANGEILGAAFWDLRAALGADAADALIHFARELFPRTFEEYLDAILVQDDLLYGDGWLHNGSPHREAILKAFAMHGIGPLQGDALEIIHQPFLDTEDGQNPRRVRASVRAELKETNAFVRLSYRRSGSGDFRHVWMLPQPDGTFASEIPAFPHGSDVDYFLAAGQYKPVVRIGRLPLNSPDEFFSYHVGPDESPPRIAFAPRTTVPSFAWPPDLYAHIEDNVGVAYAFVEYRINGEPGAVLGMVQSPEDPKVYRTRFPDVGGAPGDNVAYWITAVDASKAAHVTRFPAVGSVQLSVVSDLLDGFEHDQGTWRHSSIVTPRPDAWQLTRQWNHTPGGRHAWLCGSEGGGYPPGVAAQLVTDWYRVDAGAMARIWSWMEASEEAAGIATDGGRVEIQSESESGWVVLDPRGGYSHTMGFETPTNAFSPGSPVLSGSDGGWRQLHFDLDPWVGRRVRLRFLYGSVPDDAGACGVQGRGWLLDDFEIVAGQPAPTDAGVPALPEVLRIQAAPNPFNPRVRLRIDVPRQAGRLRLEILDARGRLLRRLLDAAPPPGSLDVVWDGTDETGLASASGVYYYRLHSKLGPATGKLVLVR